ncbi:MAG TPA: hypothetical protein VNH18_06340 [Bryobacteraceae bacterium]|nr:hypothetical protein [Bryobacteraceae bacterium]
MHARGATGDAAAQSGTLASVEGSRLRVHVAHPLAAGTLVEVSSGERIYLGTICSCHDGTVLIEAEHELDKAALEAIQRVWGRPTR